MLLAMFVANELTVVFFWDQNVFRYSSEGARPGSAAAADFTRAHGQCKRCIRRRHVWQKSQRNPNADSDPKVFAAKLSCISKGVKA